VGQVDFESI